MHVLFHGTGPYPKGVKIGPACWPHYDVMIVTKGAIRLVLGRRSLELVEGDALIIPPWTKFHGEGTRADSSIWVLHYRAALPPRKKIYRCGITGIFARELLAEISRVVRQAGKNHIYLDELANTLLAVLEASTTSLRPRDIRQDRLLPPGTELHKVREMAQAAGLSDSHYRARFRRSTGLSPRAFLRRAKAEKAQQLLRETRQPIKEIAQMVGYKDVVSFHRAFTAQCGCTPARFRRNMPSVA